jgi:hypothetical protein
VVVTQDSVYQAVTTLRRLPGDDAKQPKYIVTVPRLGYRLIAPVRAADVEPALELPPPSVRSWRVAWWYAAAVLLVTVSVLLWRASAIPDAKSVAVLPFLDLTSQAMDEEYFADGLTEALIDRLSREAGFKVPAAAASYYYKKSRCHRRRLRKSCALPICSREACVNRARLCASRPVSHAPATLLRIWTQT